MTIDELIKEGSDKVRRDSNLMAFYTDTFKEVFGYKPSCAGCTFQSDWRKLISKFGNKKQAIMKHNENTTFVLRKSKGEILRFVHEGKTYRKYDNKLTEDFVLAFLTYGSESEIEERKKLFSKLPEKFNENKNVNEITEVSEVIKEVEVIKVTETKQRKKRTKK